MSTTSEPGSELKPATRHFLAYRRTVHRVVEAQHRISTNRLVDGMVEQAMLERLVEEVKPRLPKAARGLHYLLATPFRYGRRTAARFRRTGARLGLFYASETMATCIAEAAYWRLLFFSRSPAAMLPGSTSEHTAFAIPIRIERLLDLTRPPDSVAEAVWMHPSDYAACQRFGAAAAEIGTQAIRYASARDPAHGANIALFDPSAFSAAAPRFEQSWHLRFDRNVLTAFAAFPAADRFSFTFTQFGLSPPHDAV